MFDPALYVTEENIHCVYYTIGKNGEDNNNDQRMRPDFPVPCLAKKF